MVRSKAALPLALCAAAAAAVVALSSACGPVNGSLAGTDIPPSAEATAAPLEFAVISDSHIKYDVLAGAGGYSTLPATRLGNLGPYLSPKSASNTHGLEAPLDFIMHTGDHLADLYGHFEWDATAKRVAPREHIDNVLENYDRALSTFDDATPYYIALGNHDDRQYQFGDGAFKYYRTWTANYWYDEAISGQRHFRFPTAGASAGGAGGPSDVDISKARDLLCYSWKQDGWLLVVLNSSARSPVDAQGKMDPARMDFEPSGFDGARYNDEMRMGDAQVAWLGKTLAANPGVPTLMFWHSAEGARADTATVALLKAHEDQVKAVFTGHTHKFARDTLPGTAIPHYVAGSTTAKTVYQMNPDGTIYRTPDTTNTDGTVKKGHYVVTGYDWPDYQPFYLVKADASDGSVTIVNESHIFEFDKNGVKGPGTHAPAIATIPGDNGSPTK